MDAQEYNTILKWFSEGNEVEFFNSDKNLWRITTSIDISDNVKDYRKKVDYHPHKKLMYLYQINGSFEVEKWDGLNWTLDDYPTWSPNYKYRIADTSKHHELMNKWAIEEVEVERYDSTLNKWVLEVNPKFSKFDSYRERKEAEYYALGLFNGEVILRRAESKSDISPGEYGFVLDAGRLNIL